MKLGEIFPELGDHVVYPSARQLARLGLLPEPTRETQYSERNVELLRAFVSMVHIQGYSRSRALGLIVTKFPLKAPALPRISSVAASPSAPQAPVTEQPNALEAIRKEKEEAERREHMLIAELSRIRGHFENFRSETAELRREIDTERKNFREQIREIDEERNKARHRIAKIEDVIKASRPKGIWERLKGAIRVFFGEAAVVHALPERAESLQDPLKKAA